MMAAKTNCGFFFFTARLDRTCAHEPGILGHRPESHSETASHRHSCRIQDQSDSRYCGDPPIEGLFACDGREALKRVVEHDH